MTSRYMTLLLLSSRLPFFLRPYTSPHAYTRVLRSNFMPRVLRAFLRPLQGRGRENPSLGIPISPPLLCTLRDILITPCFRPFLHLSRGFAARGQFVKISRASTNGDNLGAREKVLFIDVGTNKYKR